MGVRSGGPVIMMLPTVAPSATSTTALPRIFGPRAFAVLLPLLLAAALLALVPSASAHGTTPVPDFVCATDTVYSLDGDSHVISKLTPSTGSFSSNGSFAVGQDDIVNALALAGSGRYIYGYNRSEDKVLRYDATTNSLDEYSGSAGSSAGSVVAGAINPANGIYYYAASNSPWKLYAFNTATNTAIGQVGTISGLFGNGDFAFDSVGNLYVVSNDNSQAGVLARITGPLPIATGSTALTPTVLSNQLPSGYGSYAAMAFDGSGELIIGTGDGKVLRVNPSSGALIATRTVSLSLHDMTSCSAPSTALVRVDLPQGRHDAADQFTVKITGGGISTGNTGTTTGSDTGLQDETGEVGGSVVVLPGTTYTITQTAAGGTDLADYTTTWTCTNLSSGATVASGNGSTGTFAAPSGSGNSVVCTFTNQPLLPAMSLEKSASSIADTNASGRPDAGDRITYSFKVTNTGNVVLKDVAVTDTKVAPVTCPAGDLNPGASKTCTATSYPLSQADVDAGSVVNTATATGKTPQGVTLTAQDSVTTPVPSLPAIDLHKAASAVSDVDANGIDAGDQVTYTLTVTNTGNVTLNPVTVSDPLLGTITCPTGPLAPGATRPCTPKVYTLTQADVDAGKVDNTATTTGKPPTGANVTDADSTSTPLPGSPGIRLDKVASAVTDVDGNGTDAGDQITYTLTVTNTGNVTLNPVTVTDPLLGGVITCPPASLAPASSKTCTLRTYTLTQADLDAGNVDNTATATGTKPGGGTVSDDGSTSTPLPRSPRIELHKSAGAITDGDGNGPDAGDTITYSFTVTNTGNVTLNPVTVADPKLGSITCPSGALAPGVTRPCTAKIYVLTQADVDATTVNNTATATGTAPNGTNVTDDDSVITSVGAHPSIRLVKSAGGVIDVNGNGADDGDQVVYTFTVTNNGNVTLANITVTDPKVGPVLCSSDPLAPGQSRTCAPRTYVLTQADVDAERVENTATATGTAPSGATVQDDDTAVVDLPATARIQLVKTASEIVDTDGNGPDAGDTITYSFTVFNTGNVALDDIEVTDPKVGPVTCPGGALVPDESFACASVSYTITAADVTAGEVVNTATVTGKTPGGSTVTDNDSTTTPVEATLTNVTVDKVSDNPSPRVGDTVTYTLTLANTGAADAHDVVVTDTLPGGVTFVSATSPCALTGSTVRCEIGTLAAGDSRALKIKVTVDPLPALGTDHQHQLDVQKTEVHVDLEAGEQVTGNVTCQPGYVVSDGSGRIDHVDQDTGTVADVHMIENRAIGDDGWRATFVNDAVGRAQAKVFAVCIRKSTEVVNGHSHDVVLHDPLTETRALPTGRTDVTLTCAPGQTPAQPGYLLDGPASVLTTYPSGANGWTFGVVNDGRATTGTFSLRCLDDLVTTASGHTHGLGLDEVRQTVTVPAGQTVDYTLTCADGSKGIVAGYDLDPGLVNLGNDPRPIIRVFKLHNPTSGPLDARLYLLCLSIRTERGADPGGEIVNTASVTTSSSETSTTDNSDSATIDVDTTAAVAPVTPKVKVSGEKVTTTVKCRGEQGRCVGKAWLVASTSKRVHGTFIKKGTVLARTTYSIRAGAKVVLKLSATSTGRTALSPRGFDKARLSIAGETWIVRITR